MSKFIQFLHSFKEHKPNKNNSIDWNYTAHFRKFVEIKGKYLKFVENEVNIVSDDLLVWCEWEPQSSAKRINETRKDYPKFIYKPYFDLSASLTKLIKKRDPKKNYYANRQNTDPYIFGSDFHYFVCRQTTKKGYTALTNLQPGDVILFGSNYKTEQWDSIKTTPNETWFVLDTVFVVSDKEPIIYRPDNFTNKIKGKVSDDYYQISFISAFSGDLDNQNNSNYNEGFKLYFGASYKNPYNGMFSFVPTLPKNEITEKGFRRPKISICNVISNGQNTNFKVTSTNSQKTKDYWERTVEQVLSQKLHLGVEFEMPENKTPIHYNILNEIFIKGKNDCIADLEEDDD